MFYIKIKDTRRKEGYRIEWKIYPELEKIKDQSVLENAIKKQYPPRTRNKIIEIWQ